MQPLCFRFLLDGNQCASNSDQLIRSTDQAISTRPQSRCAVSRIIRRLDRSTAETDLRALSPTPAAQQRIDCDVDEQQQDERALGLISPLPPRSCNNTAAKSAMMTSTRSLCARCSVLARVACVAMRRCSREPSSSFRTLVESRAAPQRCRYHATGQNSKLATSEAVKIGSGRFLR